MKQKDIILIVVIMIIAGIFSFIVSGMIFGKPADRKTQVEVVEPISADFLKLIKDTLIRTLSIQRN